MSITAGQKLNGKITSVKKFGAFVELENGNQDLYTLVSYLKNS